jgi:hypothetical protein
MLSFVPVEVKLINLLTFKNLQLCRNLLFPLKKNRLVVMLCRLILSILWMVLELILREFLRWVLLSLWTRLKRKMYTGCIGTAGQIEPAFAHRRAKIPERGAPIRKSLRSIFRSGPTRAAGVYRSNAAMGF